MAKSSKLPVDDSEVVAPVASTAIAAPAPKAQPSKGLITDLQSAPSVVASKFIAVRPGSAIIEAMEANGQSGEKFRLSDLPQAKVPSSGETTWVIKGIAGSELAEEIKGVLVFYGNAGVLWGSEDMKEGSKPVLITHDFVTAIQISDDFGDLDQMAIEECFLREEGEGSAKRKIYDWVKLPYNVWGSGRNGGKRCREQRLLCVLREEDYAPIFVRVPPTSVSNVASFMRKLTIQTQRKHFESIVALKLEKETSSEGKPFGKIKIESKGFITKEEGALIKAVYTDSLGQAMSEAVTEAESTVPEGELVTA